MTKRVLSMLMASAVSLTALGALPAIAAPHGHGYAHADGGRGGEHRKGEHMGGGMDRIFKQLDLTAEQQQKIKTIHQQRNEQSKAQRQQLNTKREELHQLVRSAGATREQAIAKQREINALQNQLAEARLSTWFEVRAVLTPEQLKKLETLKPQPKRRGGA